MKKQSKLLKVISIIMIVLGAINVASSIFTLAMSSTLAETYATLGIEAPTMFAYILSIIGSIIILVAGILGVMYKSRQTVLIIGLIYCAYTVISIVYNSATTGFAALSLIGLIWPLLYMWGWYQSN